MSYDVIYTNKSLKQLKKLSETVSESIISSIDELKNDPYCNIKKLKGTGNNLCILTGLGNIESS